jgi:tryptophan halogenase
LPRDQHRPVGHDKYNTMLEIELEEIRDFLVLHYTATSANDTPFWRHCQAIRKPDSLVQKWEMYERSAVIVAPPGELFRESSWFAVFTGQNVIPKTWQPERGHSLQRRTRATLSAHQRRRAQTRRRVPHSRRSTSACTARRRRSREADDGESDVNQPTRQARRAASTH